MDFCEAKFAASWGGWTLEFVGKGVRIVGAPNQEQHNHTVDGRNPKQPPGMYKTLKNNGINYQPQLVSRISSINSIFSVADLLHLFSRRMSSKNQPRHLTKAWASRRVINPRVQTIVP